MLNATIFLLVCALVAQCWAVVLALLQWPRLRQERFAWTCITIALILLVMRRLGPLEWALSTGLFDFIGALGDCLISFLWLLGVIGLRRLLDAGEAQRTRLEALAGIDPLTGLHNRSELFLRAEQEILRAQRNGETMAVLMIDLDRFRAVNARHGHALGDALLQSIATAIRQTVRRIDVAGRIGGEEFVIVLPDTSAEAALSAAERLRQAVADAVADIDGKRVSVTASIGVTVADCQPRQAPAAYFKGLLQEADTALEIAQQRGHDRVECWQPEMSIQAT